MFALNRWRHKSWLKLAGLGALSLGVGYAVDSADGSALLDENATWRRLRSSFYECYFGFSNLIGVRSYIEEPYQSDVAHGSYLRCAIDSLEKAHQIVRIDVDDRLRRKILRKAHRYVLKAVNSVDDVEQAEMARKWYGLILLKRSKYGNTERRLRRAVDELEKAVMIDTHDSRVWEYLGIAQSELGNHQAAVDCHIRASNLQSGNCPQNWYHLGKTLKRLNDDSSHQLSCDAFHRAASGHCVSVADTVVRRSLRDYITDCKQYL